MIHIIHKQKVTLKMKEVTEAWKIQDRLSHLCKTSLNMELESVLNHACHADEYIRIDKLELDIGNISLLNFESQFRERLSDELSKALLGIKHFTGKNVKIFTPVESKLNSLMYFLEYGYFPWYAANNSMDGWEESLKTTLTASDWSEFAQWLQKQGEANEYLITRLILQFSDDFLVFFTTALYSSAGFNIQVYNDIVSLFRIVENIHEQALRQKTWRIILGRLSAASPENNLIPGILKSYILTVDLLSVIKSISPAQKKDIRELLSFGKSTSVIYSSIVSILLFSKSKDVQTIPNISKPGNGKEYALTSEIVRNSFMKILRDYLLNDTPEKKDGDFIRGDVTTDTKNTQGNRDDGQSIENTMSSDSGDAGNSQIENSESILIEKFDRFKEQGEKKHARMKRKDEILERDGVLAQNCGIVLLHPFLKDYFTAIGLYSESAFINEESRKKASLFLNFLATGKNEAPEFDLVFQKILCGIDLEEPVPKSFDLSEKEERGD